MNCIKLVLCVFGALFIFMGSNKVLGGELTSVTATPRNPAAGEENIYDFTFTTSDTGNGTDIGIPADGKIILIFPTGFDVSFAEIAIMTFQGGVPGGFSIISTSGDTITLQRDSTGTAVGIDVSVTLTIVNIGNHQVTGSYAVQIETQKADSTYIDSGTSSAFTITHGTLDHFTFNPIADQTANVPFAITIRAKDAYENTVTSFIYSVNLRDNTGTLTPATTTNFIAGMWSGNVTITQTALNNNITATFGGDAGTSNNFNVNPGAVNHFRFDFIGSPKTAGVPFNVTITAEDANNNRVTTFIDNVTLTDNTGTLTPGSSGNFVSGQWTGNVIITKKQNDVVISATNNGATGQSNSFNIQAANLNHFIVSNVANQIAGIPFSITVYARDEFNNIVDTFTGSVDITDLTHGITPTRSGTFSFGQWSGNVTINQAYTNDIIHVTRTTGGSESGSSNGFNIIAGSLDHFNISTISSQTAGNPFSISITAKDEHNNTITSFSETANLSDLTSTITPTVTGSFSNGVWTGTVVITKTRSGNTITAISSGKSGTSNSFNINAGPLHHFTFNTITSPQTARQSFNITITAEDQFNNRQTSFNQTVNLTDDTGTLTPSPSGNFNSGQWTGSVVITKSQEDVVITASQSGITGRSNSFNVFPSVLDHFSISPISTQAVGSPFIITITAQDYDDNRVNTFTGTVAISDLSGAVSPTTSTNFDGGVWSGNIVINNPYSNNRISVVRTGGSESGNSNYFDVVAGEVHHFTISSISNQTAGNPFEITITAEDASNSTVTSFTGTVNLTDNTGTISPQTTGYFTNGVWRGNVTITKSYTNDIITVSGSGRVGYSNTFNIESNNIHHFNFSNISSPQTAGQNFTITITAKDQYENTVTSFTQQANLSVNKGTIEPTITGNFSNGVRSQSVRIINADNNLQITANYSTVTGTSNYFNIEAAALHHFSLATISTQQAGVPFIIAVTAQDEFNNIKTQFLGTVYISDFTGTIMPQVSGNFSNGQWSGNVTITQTRTNNIITVQRTGGTEIGTSNAFNVISSTVDHFTFSTINSPQEAGIPFGVTITAKDAQNNTVTSFNGTGLLSDKTGTITPTETGSFSSGVWTGNVTLTKNYTNNAITITYSNKSSTSNQFNVIHTDLDHFRFATVNSPKTAGVPFNITIYAEDEYNNLVTGFITYVDLSDNTGTLNPVESGNFVSGSWTGSVTITKSASDVMIVSSRFGSSGQSNSFNTIANSLNQFTLGSISTQAAGEPFSISATAQDVYGNTQTQFTGTVNISDLTGTITPQVSGNFTQGRWTGTVVITQARQNDQITIQRTGGPEKGTSGSFDVISSTVDHFDFNPITSPQQAGVPFIVTITAKDAQNNTVTGFTGAGILNDKTGTIQPSETGNFSGGVWTGNIVITKSWANNVITITSSGRAGTSNIFNVIHSDLDHFRFETVSSPQVAGTDFNITIYAEDAYNNRVTSFGTNVNLGDNTGTINPFVSGNFVSGSWTGAVRITKTFSDVIITASQSGKNGYTNSFNVVAAALHHFTLGTISTQAAGQPFAISVTAQDVYGNIRTQFTGTVNISDLSGTITPNVSGNFTLGYWTGNVVITEANQDNKITVQRTGGSEIGTSGFFDVISSTVDHFDFNVINSPQEAGVPFSITITAKDVQNNIVTNFSGTGELDDKTGTIMPKATGNFSSGVWTGNVTITKSMSTNSISITSSGKASASNTFNVNHTDLDHFKFGNINSPQIAGSPFFVTITAEDQYNNIVSSFISYISLTESTGTISPSTTTNFTNGVWSNLVTITRSQNDLRLTATGSGKSGQSNFFNVIAGSLNSFSISSISTQAAGEPFAITITALDAYSNVAKSFIGTVDIDDLTGTIDPSASDNFSDGKWTGNVSITQVISNNRITVTRTGGTQTGQSNYFNVIASQVDHFIIGSISSPKTAGQSFTIAITAKDKDNNTVDSFTGTASLSDLTGTITPKTTSNFVNGVWSGDATITMSWTNNMISVSSSGKAGTSNTFNVTHNNLDHFTFASILSPQIAGNPIAIVITAKDQYDNTVTSYSSQLNLTDVTGTITPTTTGNFSSGGWSGAVTITKSQNDVYISASGSGKTGVSNSFNINSGSLHHFSLATINTQATGEPFSISVTAQDAYNNTATLFAGTVNITDLTNTISPSSSSNFSLGKWTGNVVIRNVMANDKITVTKTGGTEKGESNPFDVISSNIDHFVISNISSSQIAGQPFEITITAEDANNNVATSFTGTASITDITATLTPNSTTAFTNGVWHGNVKITKAKTGDKITVTAAGKAGSSNEFNVIHGAIGHFVIESIPSPQIAGSPFLMTIIAKDSMDNTVTSFSNSVTISDNTNTITPTVASNFVAGKWINYVTITKSQPDIYITVSWNGKIGRSNNFYVKPNQVNYLKITDAAGGKGIEVGDRSMTLDDKITMYASGYDVYNNYVKDVNAYWSVTGNLDLPSPIFGKWTVFDPQTPGTVGKIIADSTSLLPDSTGTFTVGAISYVKIMTDRGGRGIELGNVTITTDDTLMLYCVGYDAGANYVGEVVAYWQSTGTLFPIVADSSDFLKYEPTRAPASGKIIVTHPIAAGDSTGIITVMSGKPVGNIMLTADPAVLPADGVSYSSITSGIIYDAHSNVVAENTLFTVHTDLGTVTSTDVSPLEGIQVAASDSGKISFVLQAPIRGGIAHVSVSSPGASATGYVDIIITSVNIKSVISDRSTVSRGQQAVPVIMNVENVGTSIITNLNAELKFIGPPPTSEDRKGDFPVVIRTDAIQDIPGGATRTLSFAVDVSEVAHLDTVTIDGVISGEMEGVIVTDDSALTTDTWLVQSPANLIITKILSPVDTVSQGQEKVLVRMFVRNEGQASAIVGQDTLSFADSLSRNITSEFIIQPQNNPQMIRGDSTVEFKFNVTVLPQATKGHVKIDGKIFAKDKNSEKAISDTSADDSTYIWFVKGAPLVGIQSLQPSQSRVSQNQTVPWYIMMKVVNNGDTGVILDSVRAKFISGGNIITNEYDIVFDSAFIGRGNDRLLGHSQDSLRITINKTGGTLGIITITGYIYLTDIGTGKHVSYQTSTGITVVKPAQFVISKVIPSQPEVTRNQGQDWYVKVVLENNGGSDIEINMNRSDSFISLSTGSDFTIKQPKSLSSGGKILFTETTDTLLFTVDGTGVTTGISYINATVSGIEMTTGSQVQAISSGQANVLIEEPANVRILSVKLIETSNSSFVNTDRQIKFEVKIENTGQDSVKEATIGLQSDGPSLDSLLTKSYAIGGGKTTTKSFIVKTANLPQPAETFAANIINALAQNTSETAGVILSQAIDSTETITIQSPAKLRIINIITPQQIRAGQVGEWSIKVVIADSGQANADFSGLSSQSVFVEINGARQEDYRIIAPDTLQSGTPILYGGTVDTLIYRITATGNISGEATIVVELNAIDVNDQSALSASFRKNITIETSAAVSLAATEVLCLNHFDDQRGVGNYVNKGRSFQIEVAVTNSGRVRIDSVLVQLTTLGNSIIMQDRLLINYIEYEQTDNVVFDITADTSFTSPEIEELFTAQVLYAKEHDSGKPATIDNSGNSTAIVTIQEPAKLAISANTLTGNSIFTTHQEFIIQAQVNNVGSADFSGSGTMAIFIPDNYQIISNGDTLYSTDEASFAKNDVVEWHILTPELPSEDDTFYVSIINPLKDKNIDSLAQVSVQRDTLIITTSSANMIINSEIIGAQDGILSLGQVFKIKSTIQFTKNYKNVKASVELPSNYKLNEGSDSTQNVISLTPIIWEVIAPDISDDEIRTANIYVIANDTLIMVDSVSFRTVEEGYIANKIKITGPAGALNHVLSTDQEFNIEVEVTSFGVTNIWSQLQLPSNYSPIVPEADSQTVTPGQGVKISWKIKASPISSLTDTIKVFTKGLESYSSQEVVSEIVALTLKLVDKANVRLVAIISSPNQATDGVVSTGQEFTIDAHLDNIGTAQIYGNYDLELTLPEGYSTSESLKKRTSVASAIQWNIKAPETPKSAQNILVTVPTGGRPLDENSNAQAYFAPGTQSKPISITTITKSVTVYLLENKTPNTVAKGDEGVPMLGLRFVNSEDDLLSNDVVLKTIKVEIKDKDGKLINEPGRTISRIAAVKYSDHNFIFGEVNNITDQAIIPIHFVHPDTISPAHPDSIDLIVDISLQASVNNFMIVIDSSSSINVEELHTTKIPFIKDELNNSGSHFQIKSDFIILMADNLKDSFGNYPNPFGSSVKKTTTIVYYLKRDTDIELKIYTLLGELVWSRSYKATEPQGRKGSHDGETAIIWDARNDRGHKVLNGVYIAYISTGFGESTFTKIAVMK